MSMHISNAINQCSWACSPYLCAFLLSKNFDPSSFLNVAPLSMSIFYLTPLKHIFCSPTYPMIISYILLSNLSHDHIISFVVQLIPWSYLCSNFSPFVINFHKRYVIPIKSLDTNWKGVHLIVTKDCIWGRWLRLEFFIFDGHHHMCWNDITWILEIPHRIFDLDTNRWGTSPYVIAWVIHLSILLVRELASLDDHLKLRITCGTTFLYDRYHVTSFERSCPISNGNLLPIKVF